MRQAAAAWLMMGMAAAQCAFDPGRFSENGCNSSVLCLARWDGGAGPAVYAGGIFTEAGQVATRAIARCDGARWTALGSGVSLASTAVFASVRAIQPFDDGSGEKLWVGGEFDAAGGQPCLNLARWDGSTWIPADFDRIVTAMAVHDAGSGPRLHVAGVSLAGGLQARIARLDPTGWTDLLLTTGWVTSLASFGGSVYAGLDPLFGALPTSALLRFDGTNWFPVLPAAAAGAVRTLRTLDDGTGPALHASVRSPAFAGNVYRWNGSSLTVLGAGFDSAPETLAIMSDGGVPRLAAGGSFTTSGGLTVRRIARWDGAAWGPAGAGMTFNASTTPCSVNALAAFDPGSGPELWAGGAFSEADLVRARNAAKWVNSNWRPTTPDTGIDEAVSALHSFDDGSGRILHAAGIFTRAGSVAASGLARWDGASWSGMGGGLGGPIGGYAATFHRTFGVIDFGAGASLYVGGNFTTAGGVAGFGHIARWNGTGFEPLGTGVAGSFWSGAPVRALAAFDDGTGLALYAAGSFFAAGGVPAANVARWNGSAWSAVGAGLPAAEVTDLQVYDDGSGPRLFACGTSLSIGGQTTAIAAWNGAQWTALPWSGAAARVLAVFDDGAGPRLFAAGYNAAIEVLGTSGWSPVPSPFDFYNAQDLEVFDGGGVRPALFVPRVTVAPGTNPVHDLVRWDGTAWTALGAAADGMIHALAVHDDGFGPALHLGGAFRHVAGAPAGRVAVWRGCGAPPTVRLGQQGGPGAGVSVLDTNLVPGHEYFNVFSFEPCPGMPGGGPYAGLCASDPAFLLFQISLPPGTPPFHVRGLEPVHVYGPYPGIPPATIDALLVGIGNGVVSSISPVTRFVVN